VQHRPGLNVGLLAAVVQQEHRVTTVATDASSVVTSTRK